MSLFFPSKTRGMFTNFRFGKSISSCKNFLNDFMAASVYNFLVWSSEVFLTHDGLCSDFKSTIRFHVDYDREIQIILHLFIFLNNLCSSLILIQGLFRSSPIRSRKCLVNSMSMSKLRSKRSAKISRSFISLGEYSWHSSSVM